MAPFVFSLAPLCALLNHLGGQSTLVPYPRFVFRMLGQGSALGSVAWLSGFGPLPSLELAALGVAGFSLWAAPEWSPGFMALRGYAGKDSRDYATPWYTPNTWMTSLCDRLLGVNKLTTLSNGQKRGWGLAYMTLRGLFLYPLFAGLAGLLACPLAWAFGAASLLQGLVYWAADSVLLGEYAEGSAAGAALAAVLYLSNH
jgi:hypothetical protein